MIEKEPRLLRIGVLGCGNIAQIAHFDAIRKSRNAELHALCDAAPDLRDKMTVLHEPRQSYARYGDMLADARVEAVIIGVADPFHIPLARQAIQAGKHVLVEKPLGVTVEECEVFRQEVRKSNCVLQVGHNRRFDPGVTFARKFIEDEMGRLMALKASYCDSTYRYTMTDNLQPAPVTSNQAVQPGQNPKADKQRYFLMTHGSHLLDTARYLGGGILSVRARCNHFFDAYCWFIEVQFANGALGHLDLTVPLRGDFEETFQVQGEHGSIKGRLHLPWFHKTGDVECFSTRDRQFHRPLGEDAHTYKRQIEGFADCILHERPQQGANIDDGVECIRALAAIAQSVQSGQSVPLVEARGGV